MSKLSSAQSRIKWSRLFMPYHIRFSLSPSMGTPNNLSCQLVSVFGYPLSKKKRGIILSIFRVLQWNFLHCSLCPWLLSYPWTPVKGVSLHLLLSYPSLCICTLSAKQFQLSYPLLLQMVLQSLKHFHGHLLHSFQKLRIFLTLGSPATVRALQKCPYWC